MDFLQRLRFAATLQRVCGRDGHADLMESAAQLIEQGSDECRRLTERVSELETTLEAAREHYRKLAASQKSKRSAG